MRQKSFKSHNNQMHCIQCLQPTADCRLTALQLSRGYLLNLQQRPCRTTHSSFHCPRIAVCQNQKMDNNDTNNNQLTTLYYNRDYNNHAIEDMFTPEKIVDGYMVKSSNMVQIDPYSKMLEDVHSLPDSLRECNVSDEEWAQLRNSLLGIQKQSICCQSFGFILFGVFAFVSMLTLMAGKHCTSNCRAIVELSDYMSEDTAAGIGLFIALMTFGGFLLGKCGPCIIQKCGMKWTCDATNFSGSTNLKVRYFTGEPYDNREDTRHNWIEFYIPATFVPPPSSASSQLHQQQESPLKTTSANVGAAGEIV